MTDIENGNPRRQNASLGSKRHCSMCGVEFTPYRRWQTFCSPRCRKAAFLMSKRVGMHSDIRSDISDIREKIGLILAEIKSIKGE